MDTLLLPMNNEILEKEIENTRNSLSTERMDMSFGEIMSMYERKELVIAPEFQRLFRWTHYQQTRFIESLLLGIPIPPIFVAEDRQNIWELVDGLQRLSTVLSFFGVLPSMPEKNKWKLAQGELIKSFEGYSYSDLPLKFQLGIKRFVCRIEIIKWNSKIDMRYELFNRLNTGGSPLTDQEIRNCIFRGMSSIVNKFLDQVASSESFVTIVEPTKKQVSEMYPQELVLRFISLFNDANKTKMKKALPEHMTEFMKELTRTDDFNYAEEELLINRILNVLKSVGGNVFKGSSGGFAAGFYDGIMFGVGKNIDFYESKDADFLRAKVNELKQSEEFKSSMGSASASKTRVLKRLEVAESIFSPK